MRLRTAGTDNTTSDYFVQRLSASGTGVTAARTNNATSWVDWCFINSGYNNEAAMYLMNPFAANVTSANSFYSSNSSNGSIDLAIWTRGFAAATSFDGFSFFPAAGGAVTMTGSVSVYGFNK